MRKTSLALIAALTAGAVAADGPLPNLSDPPVVPIVRGPGTGAAVGAPLAITQGQPGQGYCTNSQNPSAPRSTYGYEVRLACDHILIGAGILGVMYMLGAASATD